MASDQAAVRVAPRVARRAQPSPGRLVAVAEEPPPEHTQLVHATYFVVEPDRRQLVELAELATDGTVRPAIDSVFPLGDAQAAFERVMASGKRGKVVIEVDDHG